MEDWWKCYWHSGVNLERISRSDPTYLRTKKTHGVLRNLAHKAVLNLIRPASHVYSLMRLCVDTGLPYQQESDTGGFSIPAQSKYTGLYAGMRRRVQGLFVSLARWYSVAERPNAPHTSTYLTVPRRLGAACAFAIGHTRSRLGVPQPTLGLH